MEDGPKSANGQHKLIPISKMIKLLTPDHVGKPEDAATTQQPPVTPLNGAYRDALA